MSNQPSAQQDFKFLNGIEQKLANGCVVSARAEAETLILHYGRMCRTDFYSGTIGLSGKARKDIEKAVARRVKGEPLQHILGKAPFYGHEFFVNADVLTPRPETEVLAEEAERILARFYPKKGPKGPSILDLGTGSGCLAVSLTIARPDCRMTALDVSVKALKTARKNIGFYRLNNRIRLVKSHFFEAFAPAKSGRWELIVSNPPYIPTAEMKGLPREVQVEPRLALDGGKKGVDAIERILKDAPKYLKDGGWILIEMGEGQAKLAKAAAAKTGAYAETHVLKDLCGVERVFTARKKGIQKTNG